MDANAQAKKRAALKPQFFLRERIYVEGNHLHCIRILHVFLGNVGTRFYIFLLSSQSSNCSSPFFPNRARYCRCPSEL